MRRADEVLETAIGDDVFDAQWNDGHALVDRAFDFALDLLGLVGPGGEDQYHDASRGDGVNDRLAPILPRRNVPRCDPAAYPAAFQASANRIRGRLVLCRIANEYIVRHKRSPQDSAAFQVPQRVLFDGELDLIGRSAASISNQLTERFPGGAEAQELSGKRGGFLQKLSKVPGLHALARAVHDQRPGISFQTPFRLRIECSEKYQKLGRKQLACPLNFRTAYPETARKLAIGIKWNVLVHKRITDFLHQTL